MSGPPSIAARAFGCAMLLWGAIGAAPPARGEGLPAGWREVALGGARDDAPTLVLIHAWGSTPDAMVTLARRMRLGVPLRVVAPAGPMPYGRGFSWFSGPLADSSDAVLAREATRAADAIARALRPRPTHVVVSGISQGGAVTFALAARHPDVADAFVPCAGLLPRRLRPARGSGVVHALHGAGDRFVARQHARESVERLQSAGRSARYEEVRGAGHRLRGPLRARFRSTLRHFLETRPASTASAEARREHVPDEP